MTDRAAMLYRQVLTLRAPAVVPQESALVASRTKLGMYLLFFSIYLLSGAGYLFCILPEHQAPKPNSGLK